MVHSLIQLGHYHSNARQFVTVTKFCIVLFQCNTKLWSIPSSSWATTTAIPGNLLLWLNFVLFCFSVIPNYGPFPYPAVPLPQQYSLLLNWIVFILFQCNTKLRSICYATATIPSSSWSTTAAAPSRPRC